MDIKTGELKGLDNLQDHMFFWPAVDRFWYWTDFLLWWVIYWNNLLKYKKKDDKDNMNQLVVDYFSTYFTPLTKKKKRP